MQAHHTTVIKRIAWTIPSRSGGADHTIEADITTPERLECTCKAGVNGRHCWALKAVEAGAAGKPVIRCTTRPALAPVRVTVSAAGRELQDALQV